MTVYLVSGNYRSGTSMMTRALKEGGLETVYIEPTGPEHYAPYHHPNPYGFFENNVTSDEVDKYDGKLLKLFAKRLLACPPVSKVQRKVVYMDRPIEKSIISYRVAFRLLPNQGVTEFFNADEAVEQIEALGNQVLRIRYHDVMANPIKEFERIKDFGFPIDVEKAVATVDPKLYRFKTTQETT